MSAAVLGQSGAQQDSLRSLAIDEVVVTGQYEPQSAKNSVYRVRTISREQIQGRASTSVENILNTQLGIRFSNDLALGETDIELLGMSGQNVKVLIDGMPLIDRGATKQSLSQVDVNSIDRIEIVEGPMSVTYGTDALAGVINIITKSAPLDDQFAVSLRLQEESAGNEYSFISNEGIHNGNLTVDWQRRGWNVVASGTRNNFGGWQGTGTGRVLQWDPKSQWLASGRLIPHSTAQHLVSPGLPQRRPAQPGCLEPEHGPGGRPEFPDLAVHPFAAVRLAGRQPVYV